MHGTPTIKHVALRMLRTNAKDTSEGSVNLKKKVKNGPRKKATTVIGGKNTINRLSPLKNKTNQGAIVKTVKSMKFSQVKIDDKKTITESKTKSSPLGNIKKPIKSKGGKKMLSKKKSISPEEVLDDDILRLGKPTEKVRKRSRLRRVKKELKTAEIKKTPIVGGKGNAFGAAAKDLPLRNKKDRDMIRKLEAMLGTSIFNDPPKTEGKKVKKKTIKKRSKSRSTSKGLRSSPRKMEIRHITTKTIEKRGYYRKRCVLRTVGKKPRYRMKGGEKKVRRKKCRRRKITKKRNSVLESEKEEEVEDVEKIKSDRDVVVVVVVVVGGGGGGGGVVVVTP
ncbi:Hypothetical predicted protein [Octopus vulgaris]|uniref:Uncharacterized protein n=1 Tax=Octopus vulgaris TaxID=6645 RepID=A0AA36BLM3_OCTVU|nr:Hypothetical predicted protein [Octopus vulgaris]